MTFIYGFISFGGLFRLEYFPSPCFCSKDGLGSFSLKQASLKQLAFSQAVELSYLTQVEQTAVISAMEKHGVKPSLSQAVRLKKLKQSGKLAVEMIDEILSESKKTPSKNDVDKETGRFRHYFPKGYTARQIDEVINSLLLEWQVREGVSAWLQHLR